MTQVKAAAVPSLVVFVVYFAAMLVIGAYVYRKNNSLSDFVLGGRSLNKWVAALSAQASDMSGFILIALPGAAYAGGLGAAWIAVGLGIGTYLNWRLNAARLRVYTEQAGASHKQGGSITISEYLENRFEDPTRLLRLISAVVIVFFFSIYVASGLAAGSLLFDEVFGIGPGPAITIMAVIIVSYTFLGGFLAVSYTDFIQGTLMWVGLLVVAAVMIATLGGGGLIDGIRSASPELLSPIGDVSIGDGGGWVAGGGIGVVVILSGLSWGLGYFGQPHILARFMGIRHATEVAPARRIAMVWVLTGLASAVFIGLAGIALFEQQLSNPETVFIDTAKELLNPWLAGILLVGVIAAIMSTADSQLLVVSSALSEDFYRTFVHRQASERTLLWVGRVTVVVVAAIAYVLALGAESVLGLVAYAWAGFGAAFGPLILVSLFWRGMTWLGALAGMLSGAATVVIWRSIDPFGWGLYELLPGFVVAIICVFVFSKIGPRPSSQMQSDFDTVRARLRESGTSSTGAPV